MPNSTQLLTADTYPLQAVVRQAAPPDRPPAELADHVRAVRSRPDGGGDLVTWQFDLPAAAGFADQGDPSSHRSGTATAVSEQTQGGTDVDEQDRDRLLYRRFLSWRQTFETHEDLGRRAHAAALQKYATHQVELPVFGQLTWRADGLGPPQAEQLLEELEQVRQMLLADTNNTGWAAVGVGQHGRPSRLMVANPTAEDPQTLATDGPTALVFTKDLGLCLQVDSHLLPIETWNTTNNGMLDARTADGASVPISGRLRQALLLLTRATPHVEVQPVAGHISYARLLLRLAKQATAAVDQQRMLMVVHERPGGPAGWQPTEEADNSHSEPDS